MGAITQPNITVSLAIAAVVAPAGVIAGITVKRFGIFRPQMWLAWVFMVVGTSLLTTVKADTSAGFMIAYLAIPSVGLGILTSTTYFPVLAPRKFPRPQYTCTGSSRFTQWMSPRMLWRWRSSRFFATSLR
jgi:hypothetical protein